MRAFQSIFRLAAILLILSASIAARNCAAAPANPGSVDATPIDDAAVRAAGIRKLESKRLTLYTDLASSPEVDELPQAFNQAFGLWCKYLGIDAARNADWHMRASLMDDEKKFRACGLLPADVPKFFNGFTRDHEFWLYNQTSPYYRRHLLLHEGVHGIMFTLIGGYAPPWYAEGMAELLATHRWENGHLELPYFPRSPSEVPKLGRIEIVQADFAKRQAKRLTDVMAYDRQAHLTVNPYGWSWAAAAFMDGHPRYHDRFHQLLTLLNQPIDFNERLRAIYGDDFDQLCEEFQVFVADIDYGYDFARTAIDFTPGKPFESQANKDVAQIMVAADRGWQNSGIELAAGKTYRLKASGQFQVADGPPAWISEAGGVSIRYVHGKPLGMLLATVRPTKPTSRVSAFLKPIVVGTSAEITPAETGTLYFKINDSAGELADNGGQLSVNVSAD
jgi:hypothetical protein